jgi:hypothetical protein
MSSSNCSNVGAAQHGTSVYGGIGQQVANNWGGIHVNPLGGTFTGGSRRQRRRKSKGLAKIRSIKRKRKSERRRSVRFWKGGNCPCNTSMGKIGPLM